MMRIRRTIQQLLPPKKTARRWWLGIALAAIAFAVVDSELESRRAAAQAEEAAFRGRAIRLSAGVTLLYQASRRRVEETLNGGQPLTGVQSVYASGSLTSEEKALFPLNAMADAALDGVPGRRNESFRADIPGRQLGPEYEGWVLRLRFLDDRLTFASYTSAERKPYAGPSAACVSIRMVRRSLMACGLIGWFGALLTLTRHSRDRRVISQIAAGCLLAIALAWSLECTPGEWAPWFIRRFAWLILLGMSIVTTAVLLWPARVREAAHSRCRKCGYDLFGNESGVCPECGTTIPPRPTDRWLTAAEKMLTVSLQDPTVSDEIDLGPDTDPPEPRKTPGHGHFAPPAPFRGKDVDDDSKVRLTK